MKLFIYAFFLFIVLIILNYCSSDTPLFPKDHKIVMTVDTDVTEAWIDLNVVNWDSKTPYFVKRDSLILFQGLLDDGKFFRKDTGLSPGNSYTYHAFARKDNKTGSHTSVTATTLDTTKHEVDWKIFEIGGQGTSFLHDVALISADDIWAVGDIHTEDTDRWNEDSTKWIKPYNAVHCDGQEWELKRIKTKGCGGVVYPPIKTVFAFSEEDILFAHIDGSITFYDGSKFRNDCSLITQLNGSARKIWGVSSEDFYVVNGNGFIAHYHGNSWRRIESGTSIDLLDIWGVNDGQLIWMCGFDELDGAILLREKDNEIIKPVVIRRSMPPQPEKINQIFKSIWTDDANWIYLGSNGRVYKMYWDNPRILSEFIWWDYANGLPPVTTSIRGNGVNDIFIAGQEGLLKHFNGITWHQYNELPENIDWYGLSVKKENLAAIGITNSFPNKAIIAIGKK
ncbi:MAG: hypothetical protein GF313_00100 [Caldithrix sp.]|nr:hypothetical protein [Caldithrix sp.]